MSPLTNVLVKFRQFEVAFSGDIRDMFHMVRIRQEDVPSLRFLWRGTARNCVPGVYQMDVMVFGAVSSPFQAQWVKNRNADEFAEEFPEAVDAIHNRHYVDDYLDSCSSADMAIKKILEVKEIHAKGGFEIRGWLSNDPEVMKVIAPGEAASESILLTDNDKLERVLGLHWKPKYDEFTFKTSFNKVDPLIMSGEKIPTKRQLLQLVMSMFDPLGFLGHLTARGRILLQNVWKSGIGWDEKVVGVCVEKWRMFLSQALNISEVRIRRCFGPKISQAKNIQIHTFCDASQQAFGAVSYVRVVGAQGNVDVNIAMSKTRVTPIKCISIPRLELEAALIGARMTKFLCSLLDVKIDKVCMWTDSRNVLYWLRAEDPSRFKMYAAHRIGEILDLTEVSEWRWVPTADNVADDCTRDEIAADLSPASRWFTGPNFLVNDTESWPKEFAHEPVPVSMKDLEVKASCMATFEEEPLVRRYSSWIRLIRITAWICRFRSNAGLKKEERNLTKCLSVEEINHANICWIKKVQKDSFAGEWAYLSQQTKADAQSRLANLSPVLIDGIIRIDSRVANASCLDFDTKFPVILDGKHPWTIMLIKWYHEIHGHYGYEKICNELRQRYWIIGMKVQVKKAAKECLDCQMRRAKKMIPKMAALPEVRTLQPSRPFTYVGVDYFGPVEIMHGRKREKRYGVLFTCLTVRAVHLEVAYSLSTDDFLMALERFISTRGEPLEMWSDNGTNFKGADKELQKSLKELDQQKISNRLIGKGISWKFTPPSAPHMGGVWERLVRSVKTSLTVILKNRTLTDPLFATVLAQSMATVNNRPITVVSEDWNDPEAITPNSFLIGSSSIQQPPGVFADDDLCTRKRWRIAQALNKHFWKRWAKEYLPSLSLRTKWRKESVNVKVGELVFVPDMNELHQQWNKGVIVSVYPGKDGNVRVVDVKTRDGIFKRPVAKLLRMEPECNGDLKDLSHEEGYIPEQNCNVFGNTADHDGSSYEEYPDDGSAYARSTDGGSAFAGSADGGSAFAGSADGGSAFAGSTYADSVDPGSSHHLENANVTKDAERRTRF